MLVVLDGSRLHAESDFHDLLARQLDFGPYYGKNLDALWDRLTTDVERPVELIWRDSAASRQLLGSEIFDKIAGILIRVMNQDESYGWDERFTVVFE